MGRLLPALMLIFGIALTFRAAGASEETLRNEEGKPERYAGKFSNAPVRIPVRYQPKRSELRGVWVATVENIDFAQHQDAASFKKEYLEVVNNLKAANCNAIFFQVRPNCDAFYASKENPWSRWMTGTEGLGIPGFDPLKFMVDEAHKRGLEFHAWLNPYRVDAAAKVPKEEYLKTRDPRNFARRHPELVLQAKLGPNRYSLLLNPGEPAVIRHIIDTVAEIVENYQIDAIHFDDYFYLYSGNEGIDTESYKRLNPKKLSLDDWRRENVNKVVRGIKAKLMELNRKTGRRVAFGISPFGIWANKQTNPAGSLTGGKQSYYAQYADTRAWVKNGWIDYIAPQLYWDFGHDVAAYACLADWWAETVKGTPVSLYIGQSASRLGTMKGWDQNELADQLRYNCKHPEIAGTILFSYSKIFRPRNAAQKAGMQKVFREYWKRPAAIPRRPNVR